MGIGTPPNWEPPKSGAFALNPHRVAACALGWGNKFPQVSKFGHTLSPLGKAWGEQLRDMLIKYHNIGYGQLNEQQKKLLQQYYDINKLLIDCFNIAVPAWVRYRKNN